MSSFLSNIHPWVLSPIPSITTVIAAKWWFLILLFLLHLLVGPFFTIKKGFRLCSIDLIESFTVVSMASWILILVSDETPLPLLFVVTLQSLGQPSHAGSRYLSVTCPSFLDYFLTSETSCSCPQSWVSPWGFDSFSRRMAFRNQDQDPRDAHCCRNILCHRV